jgi:ribonuclease Z
VHEAARDTQGGHTTFREAAEVAREAGVRRLVLVHLPPGVDEDDLREAREVFPGLVLGRDGDRHEF